MRSTGFTCTSCTTLTRKSRCPQSAGALLASLQREGKIAAIGLSNVTAAQLDEARAVAPIAAVQNRLSYVHPGDLPMVLACAERGVAYRAGWPVRRTALNPILRVAIADGEPTWRVRGIASG